ncbi:MAG: hypothetical protein ACYDGN_16680 [Acidimicrobiales bacterium]
MAVVRGCPAEDERRRPEILLELAEFTEVLDAYHHLHWATMALDDRVATALMALFVQESV